jgi:hypothetical protein
MNAITATLTNRPRKFLTSQRKENGLTRGYKVIDMAHRDYNNQPRTIADVRIYFPGSVCYCAAWINNGKTSTSGTGKASGYGYHMESGAVSDALRNAGFDFSERFHGVGTQAQEAAIMAAAQAIAEPGAELYLIDFYG